MTKIRQTLRLVLLAALASLAGIAQAQLTEYECWFDNGVGGFNGVLSGFESTVTVNAQTGSLSPGLHTFSFRARQSDGYYSPVTTSTFLKFSAITGSMLEYWIDGGFPYRDAATLSAGEEGIATLSLDLSDAKYAVGLHTLYFRVAAQGGNYSPIYSSQFLKYEVGQGSMLEYWFDDRFGSHNAIEVNTSVEGLQPLQLDLSNTEAFPIGLHRLNMRLSMFGNLYSPVYSAYVMRLQDAKATEVSFWLDDDWAGRRIVAGQAGDQMVNVSGVLDFNDAVPGIHRLHYRVCSQGEDEGVTYEVPLLVKSRYRRQEDAVIIGETHWVDDPLDCSAVNFSTPQQTFTHQITLSPDDYEDGLHSYSVQYENSAGVWSETNVTYFYKDPISKLLSPGRPTDITALDMPSDIICTYAHGSIIVDGQTVSTATPCTILITDLQGRTLALRKVSGSDVIHAEIDMADASHQMVLVRISCGKLLRTHKFVL